MNYIRISNSKKQEKTMLNAHQLNMFVIAAETLNFTKTAKRLHLTQSSVSQHIKSLEGQLGVDLFVRIGRTLKITDAGTILLPMAREIVNDSIRAIEHMEQLKHEIHGHLIVGCNTAAGKYMLPVLLSKFHAQYPLVKISCQVQPQKQTMGGLKEGDIHFAITNMFEEDQHFGEIILYYEEPIYLIAPNDHPWAIKGSISPDELIDGEFIMREKASGTYRYVKRGLTSLGVDTEELNVFLEMGTSEALALAVERGLGVGFVSKMILDKICSGGEKVVKVEGLEIVQKLFFARQTAYPSTGAQSVFWDFVRNAGVEMYKSD